MKIMYDFEELNNLIDKYLKDICLEIEKTKYGGFENRAFLQSHLKKECNLRHFKINEFIHSKYPNEMPININGNAQHTINTVLNIKAQGILAKRRNEFQLLCNQYYEQLDSRHSAEEN